MAADDLPRKFDVIVVGTGLLESIIAAAFSRVGHTVLHIDRNDYYCGDWASFNLHGLDEWCAEQQSSHPDPLERPESDEVDELKEGDTLVECPLYGKTHSNIETGFLIGDKEPEQLTSEDESDKPVVGPCGDSSCPAAPETSPDIAPADTANGNDEHRTTESSITEQCPVPSEENTEAIPCLTETNSTNQVTSTTADARREDITEEVPTETETCQSNIKDVPKTENTQKFILSLGRYGNTAFLWPLYGTGELPQSYARMCAVFGGIYCLRMTASSIIVDEENKYRGIITTEGHRIESKWLISETSYLPKQYLPTGYGSRQTSRAVLLTDQSIQQADSEQLTLLHLPCPGDSNRPVTVLELGPSSMACPQGLYLVHLSRQGAENTCTAREDLQYAVDLLFSDTESKPSILWYLYFSQSNTQGLVSRCPENIVTIPGPGSELDMDHVVKQARDIFTKLCPDEEFLPKAPNPEDIIFDDGMCREASEGFQAPSADHSGGSPDQQITDENSRDDKPPESSGNSETVETTDSERNNQAETRTQSDETAQSEITSDTPAEETTNLKGPETAEVSTT